MKAIEMTPRRAVILFYLMLCVLWSVLAGTFDPAPPEGGREAASHAAALVMSLLAVHALVVAILAWRASRWFFGHGILAVLFAGLPFVALALMLWIVGALAYLIGAAYVHAASTRVAPGKLQTSSKRQTVE